MQSLAKVCQSNLSHGVQRRRCLAFAAFFVSVCGVKIVGRPSSLPSCRGHAESVQIEYDPDIISYQAGRAKCIGCKVVATDKQGKLGVSGCSRVVSLLSFGAEFRGRGQVSFGSGRGQFIVRIATTSLQAAGVHVAITSRTGYK